MKTPDADINVPTKTPEEIKRIAETCLNLPAHKACNFCDLFAECGGGADYVIRSLYDLVHCLESRLAQAEWISVNDRLPEEQKKILVVDGHGYVEILSLWKKENNRWTWLDSTGHFNHKNDVTHWMPLPQPPKED